MGTVHLVHARPDSRVAKRLRADRHSLARRGAGAPAQARPPHGRAGCDGAQSSAEPDCRGPRFGVAARKLPHPRAEGAGRAAAIRWGDVHDDGRSVVVQAERPLQVGPRARPAAGRHCRQGRQLFAQRRPATGRRATGRGGVADERDRRVADGQWRGDLRYARGRALQRRRRSVHTERHAHPRDLVGVGRGTRLPERVEFGGLRPAPGSELRLLGVREPLAWSTDAAGRISITIPAEVRAAPPCAHAWVFAFDAAP